MARAPNGLPDRVKLRSCERPEARGGRILDVFDRRATKGRDANGRFHDGRQTVRCSKLRRCSLALALFAAPLVLIGCSGGGGKTGSVTQDGSSVTTDAPNVPGRDATSADLALLTPTDGPVGAPDAPVARPDGAADSGLVSPPDAPVGAPDGAVDSRLVAGEAARPPRRMRRSTIARSRATSPSPRRMRRSTIGRRQAIPVPWSRPMRVRVPS